MTSCGIHLRAISHWVPKLLFCIMSLKIVSLKSLPHLPWTNKLIKTTLGCHSPLPAADDKPTTKDTKLVWLYALANCSASAKSLPLSTYIEINISWTNMSSKTKTTTLIKNCSTQYDLRHPTKYETACTCIWHLHCCISETLKCWNMNLFLTYVQVWHCVMYW